MLLAEASIKMEQSEIIREIGSPSHSQRLADHLNRILERKCRRGGSLNIEGDEFNVLISTGIWGTILRPGSRYCAGRRIR